jgi:hypothetical protein
LAKTFTRKHIAVTAVVAFLLAGGVFLWVYLSSGSDAAGVRTGDCANISGTELRKVDCDSAEMTHIVGKTLAKSEETCTEPYQDYAEGGVKLCLIPNMPEGFCFDGTVESFDVTPAKLPCDDKRAAKVVKVMKGSVDDSACPKDSTASVYPEPPMTQCILPIGQ